MRRHPITALAAVAVAAGAVIVATIGPAAADSSTPLYVNNATGSNCSDSGTGALSRPYCTISAAVAAVVPGQTINVTGSYTERVRIAKSGTSGHPITLQGGRLTGSNASVTIDGQHDVSIVGLSLFNPLLPDGAAAVTVSNSTRIAFQSVSVSAATASAPDASIVGYQLHAVTNSSLTGGGGGGPKVSTALTMDAATTGVVVKGASFTANYPPGQASIDVAGANNTIINSTVRGGAVGGIVLEPGASNNVVANNTALYGRANGIYNHGATGTAITNNLVRFSCGTGIRVDGASSGVSVQNNISGNNPPDPAPSACSPAIPDAVNIGVYDSAVNGTIVDYNTVYQTKAGALSYAWSTSTPLSLAAFQAASHQAAHDIDSADPSVNYDSANSAAPGYQSTDVHGYGREDDPEVEPNAGAGTVNYADRGPSELIKGPTATLTATVNQNTGTVTANASGTTPGWARIASYAFDFGDGSPVVTQSTPTASHRYATAGTPQVRVTVTDANGQSSTADWQGRLCPPAPTGSGARTLRADFNGDGRDDIALFYDYGGGHVAVFTLTGRACGQFDPPVRRWDGPWWGPGTKFLTTGDFNGDGKADIGLFYDYGGGHVAVFTLTANSNGNGGFAPPALRWNGPWWGPGTRFATTGDFNGDHKTDLALLYDYGGGHVAAFTFTSTGSGLSAPVLRWNGPWWGPGTRFAGAGDFNGDGRDDVVLFYDYGGGHVAVFTLTSTGSGLSAPALGWDSPYWGRHTTQMTVGNYNGDKRDDIALLYNYPQNSGSSGSGSRLSQLGLFALTASTANDHRFAAPTQIWHTLYAWGLTMKFMVSDTFTAGRDGFVLFDDAGQGPVSAYAVSPDAANAYDLKTSLIWSGPWWGPGTEAVG